VKKTKLAALAAILVVPLLFAGASLAQRDGPPPLGEVTITPLNSFLALPLDQCVEAAKAYADTHFPGDEPRKDKAPQVLFARVVTDADFKTLAPGIAKDFPSWGANMKLVVLKGDFVLRAKGQHSPVQFALMIMTPNCLVSGLAFPNAEQLSGFISP
jgi:hypothetical protein